MTEPTDADRGKAAELLRSAVTQRNSDALAEAIAAALAQARADGRAQARLALRAAAQEAREQHGTASSAAKLIDARADNLVDRPTPKRCPECGAVMDPTRAWLWTAYGATDTENCARLLVAREERDER